jgi:hypothetical protein
MLDVHAPHKRLEGISEFFLHLFTITVGLLIATQIESCEEWRTHAHLAQEARTEMRAEITHNLSDLKDAEDTMKKWRAETDANRAAMTRIQNAPNDPAAQKASMSFNFHSMSLRDTAWKTAEATSALAYMPYEEARRYAGVYQAQADLLAQENVPQGDVAALLGMVARFDWNDKNKITAEQAGEVAEKLAVMKLHLVTLDLMLRSNIEVSSALLENREARDNFEEHFK